MLATMGLIFAIALLVVMIIKGIDMICATVITAVIILFRRSSYHILRRRRRFRNFLVPDPGDGRHLRTAGAGNRTGHKNRQVADAEAGS